VTPPTTLDRRPLVTAVVAAHDAGRHVGRAVGSLLRQTMDDLEVVVVDDGSTDGTVRVVEEAIRAAPRVRLLRLGRNRGQAAALGVGMEAARGRLVAILDADDEATPARLAEQVVAFERDPDLVLLGGSVAPFCDRHDVEGPIWRYAVDDEAIRVRTAFKSEVISGAITLDRERAEAHHLRFDGSLRLGVDWALSFAAMRFGRVGNLPSVVMRYRIHPGQMTTGMLDDLGSDSTRIRRTVLAWMGVAPTDEEMRIHLAISPCNYWPFGSHPFFLARRATIRREAGRWLARLTEAAARTGRVPAGPMRAYADEILARVERALEQPAGDGTVASRHCPVAVPLACVAGEACR
jgi:glycosyltransferase involved in cell wall biosynthesis